MNVLMTGHNGYVGSIMARVLMEAGHAVKGMDTDLFEDCLIGGAHEVSGDHLDIRDVSGSEFEGVDAVVHLAALCNDPLGNMDPSLTFEINHRASLELARKAKAAGATRFLFASSCSLYGVAGEGLLQEDAPFNPITPYGETKVLLERDLATLADDSFSPSFLRNSTAYGFSPRLRADVVLNNLVGAALTTGEVLIKSDGTPWRPIVHVEDFSRAFLAVLESPREVVHNQAYNVGRTSENYRVSDLAEIVEATVPGSRIEYEEGGGPDPRSYRVDCGKLEALPGYDPQWTAAKGAAELLQCYQEHGMTKELFDGSRFFRIRRIQELQAAGRLGGDFRWTA